MDTVTKGIGSAVLLLLWYIAAIGSMGVLALVVLALPPWVREILMWAPVTILIVLPVICIIGVVLYTHIVRPGRATAPEQDDA